jgi:hypothetical protein
VAQACPHFYQNSLSPHCDADAGGWVGLVTSGACCGLSGKWFSMLMWCFLNHYSTEKNEIRREAVEANQGVPGVQPEQGNMSYRHESCRRFSLSCPGSLMTAQSDCVGVCMVIRCAASRCALHSGKSLTPFRIMVASIVTAERKRALGVLSVKLGAARADIQK